MKELRSIIYADRLFGCADGKTAHGLVRYSKKYKVTCVVDSTLPTGDAGEILDGINRGIPLFNDLNKALASTHADTFIIGAVSEGGVLPKGYDKTIVWALSNGLNVVSGLHQFLSDDPKFRKLAEKNGCTITDVRKIFRDYRRFYTGEIKKVTSTRIAVLGTDSAVGKRTLAGLIVETLKRRKMKADMIFTGQTGWLQGWPHGVVIDAMISDFVAGGIESAILESWRKEKPEFMVIEGQGSLVHPFFPGGFEILTAGQIHGFILVDAPGRPHLDGFPGYSMPNPKRVVKIAQLLTEKSLLGISINNEKMTPQEVKNTKRKLRQTFHVPVVDPIVDGVDHIVNKLEEIQNG